MANPITVAVRGKGFWPMLQRGGTLVKRYGLTAAKMESELKLLSDTLLAFGCAATLPVTAKSLARHPKLAQKLQMQGIELAVHGLKHIDYTQLPLDKLVSDLQQARQIFFQAGLHVSGFRSPYLRWNAETISALCDCGFDYDSSQALAWDVIGGLESESYQHALQFYDAQLASQHPSLPRLDGSLVRIPYCLPDDEALVERLKLSTGQAMTEIWLGMLDCIYTAGELFILGLHPERASLCKESLQAILVKALSLSPSVWIARLDEITAWYRSLGKVWFETQIQSEGSIRVTVHAPVEAILLARSVDVEAPRKAWGLGYERVLSNEIEFYGELYPWIGLAPDCPTSLQSFLQHQGYLVEVSTDPPAYSYYFQPKMFRPEDERPLLAELETGSRPLIRLGRWPGGAQAALAVTGDVDAITLWDYGLRVWNR